MSRIYEALKLVAANARGELARPLGKVSASWKWREQRRKPKVGIGCGLSLYTAVGRGGISVL